jgi:hypothetical protein
MIFAGVNMLSRLALKSFEVITNGIRITKINGSTDG